MEKISTNRAIHSIGYHIIWCPKFRNNVLKDEIAISLKQIIGETCGHYGWKIHALEIMPDHIHIFVQADHLTIPNEIAKTLKSISAVHLFSQFPTLKQRKFWGTGLWSKGTYYASVGSISEASIKKYIEEQFIHRP